MALTREVTCIFNLISECCLLLFNVQLFLLFFLILFPFITIQENKKYNPVKRSKDAFTRFSVLNFSSVLDSLTLKNREVIENAGFGSLLLFDKCYIPNQFVKWVAKLVNYKSADIVVDGKVISLAKESVHLVLGLPFGVKPFPIDSSIGKAVVLSMFEKQSISSVNFFDKNLRSMKLSQMKS